ncbi:hypothetical protein LINGRAHAP2_LOCUS5698, partial [Linum grandiflorum]
MSSKVVIVLLLATLLVVPTPAVNAAARPTSVFNQKGGVATNGGSWRMQGDKPALLGMPVSCSDTAKQCGFLGSCCECSRCIW